MNKKQLLIIFIAGLIGLLIGYGSSSRKSKALKADQLASGKMSSQELSVPEDAIELSECEPNMGFHWGNPEDLPFGPIYLTDGEKTIGIEYMIDEEQLEETQTIRAHGMQMQVGPAVSMQMPSVAFDHLDIQYYEDGHEQYEVAHYDIHAFTISKEEQSQLCI